MQEKHVAVEGRIKNLSLHMLLLIIARLYHLKQKETVHVALLSLVRRFLGMSSLVSDLPGEKHHDLKFILPIDGQSQMSAETGRPQPFFQVLWWTIPGSNCISTNTFKENLKLGPR